jgi:hypothetical protein
MISTIVAAETWERTTQDLDAEEEPKVAILDRWR